VFNRQFDFDARPIGVVIVAMGLWDIDAMSKIIRRADRAKLMTTSPEFGR
jgi:hypothetical protein